MSEGLHIEDEVNLSDLETLLEQEKKWLAEDMNIKREREHDLAKLDEAGHSELGDQLEAYLRAMEEEEKSKVQLIKEIEEAIEAMRRSMK
ncbi:MAG TPA: hypothetical protein VJJ22_04415 [Candidatus Paceibacterota bacterium]